MSTATTSQKGLTVKKMTLTAVFMALNIALSSFGLPVPGGHLYLNDIVIVTASLLLEPFEAFMVGGVGAFLGDLFFYPTPMFVSLVVHGLQAFLISSFSHPKNGKSTLKKDILGVSLGALVMIGGYTFGRAFLYATPQAALLKLPYQIIQAVAGALFGTVLVYRLKLKEKISKFF